MEITFYANTAPFKVFHHYSPSDLFACISSKFAELLPIDSDIDYYGNCGLVNDLSQADFVLLSLKWNDYVDSKNLFLAIAEAERAISAGKRIVIASEGDSPANASIERAIIFERAGYASRRGYLEQQIFGLPAFIDDYLALYCDGKLQVRPKSSKPIVGFCGQSGGSAFDFIRRQLKNYADRLAYILRIRAWEPSPFETTWFRKKILDEFKGNNAVSTNFLVRKRYRAGYLTKNKDPFHPTRIDFIHNIINSDYTLCMRGGGNFSVRFYEALSLGRIPIFVNTDCILPLDHLIDYRQYCVWIEQDEIPYIAEKVADFHSRLSSSDFKNLQFKCRQLWQDYLSRRGFYKNFHHHFQGR